MKINIEDKILDYPAVRKTGSPFKDRIYNWVVARYKKNNHPWKKSDERVFSGFIYGVLSYLGAVLFMGFFGFLLFQVDKLFGFERAVLLGILLLLFRVNIMIKQQVELNAKF